MAGKDDKSDSGPGRRPRRKPFPHSARKEPPRPRVPSRDAAAQQGEVSASTSELTAQIEILRDHTKRLRRMLDACESDKEKIRRERGLRWPPWQVLYVLRFSNAVSYVEIEPHLNLSHKELAETLDLLFDLGFIALDPKSKKANPRLLITNDGRDWLVKHGPPP
jgi:hypothetical protein